MSRKPFSLPPADCERLNKQEFAAVKWAIVADHLIKTGQPDLADRLECIPYGKERFRLACGQLDAVVCDLIGTITAPQTKQLNNVLAEMQVQLVPKYAPLTHNAIISLENLTYMIKQSQQNKCLGCVKDDRENRACTLYKILEAYAPRVDYGSSGICPYSDGSWMNDPDEDD